MDGGSRVFASDYELNPIEIDGVVRHFKLVPFTVKIYADAEAYLMRERVSRTDVAYQLAKKMIKDGFTDVAEKILNKAVSDEMVDATNNRIDPQAVQEWLDSYPGLIWVNQKLFREKTPSGEVMVSEETIIQIMSVIGQSEIERVVMRQTGMDDLGKKTGQDFTNESCPENQDKEKTGSVFGIGEGSVVSSPENTDGNQMMFQI